MGWGREVVVGSLREDEMSCCSFGRREVGDKKGMGWGCLVFFFFFFNSINCVFQYER